MFCRSIVFPVLSAVVSFQVSLLLSADLRRSAAPAAGSLSLAWRGKGRDPSGECSRPRGCPSPAQPWPGEAAAPLSARSTSSECGSAVAENKTASSALLGVTSFQQNCSDSWQWKWRLPGCWLGSSGPAAPAEGARCSLPRSRVPPALRSAGPRSPTPAVASPVPTCPRKFACRP